MSESFSALLDESLSSLDMQPGSIVSGVVLDIDKDYVTVHVGLKSEGIISLDEFKNNEPVMDIVKFIEGSASRAICQPKNGNKNT